MRLLLRQIWRNQRGFALPFALGTMLMLSASSTAVFDYASSTPRASTAAAAQLGAGGLAEAGINTAYSILNYEDTSTFRNKATDATLLGCEPTGTFCTAKTITLPAGTASFYGVYNKTTSVWTIVSTGTERNPSGGAPLSKSVTVSYKRFAAATDIR
jgi:Tfp pilus assembly protein PilX